MTNQTVYIVLYEPDIDTCEVNAVFTTREAAEEFITARVAEYSWLTSKDFTILSKTLNGA